MTTSKSLLVAVVALLAVVLGPAAATFELLGPMVGFLIYLGGGALGLVAMIWGVVAKRRGRARGGALAVLLGGLPLLAVAIPAAVSMTRGYPRINDVSTDTADPPAFIESTQHGDYPDGFAEKVKTSYPKVTTLELPLPPERALIVALEVARARDGWEIVATTDSGFEGYQRSKLFKFRDDFVVRVRPSNGGSLIDMRSASRDGEGDFGVNAGRIEGFFAAVAERAR